MPNIVAFGEMPENSIVQKSVCVGEQPDSHSSAYAPPNIPTDAAGDHRMKQIETAAMTCKKCKFTMKELKGHIFHGKRKWRCPQCQKVKMQKPKSKGEAHGNQ